MKQKNWIEVFQIAICAEEKIACYCQDAKGKHSRHAKRRENHCGGNEAYEINPGHRLDYPCREKAQSRFAIQGSYTLLPQKAQNSVKRSRGD
jgi:hypothetical protein